MWSTLSIKHARQRRWRWDANGHTMLLVNQFSCFVFSCEFFTRPALRLCNATQLVGSAITGRTQPQKGLIPLHGPRWRTLSALEISLDHFVNSIHVDDRFLTWITTEAAPGVLCVVPLKMCLNAVRSLVVLVEIAIQACTYRTFIRTDSGAPLYAELTRVEIMLI